MPAPHPSRTFYPYAFLHSAPRRSALLLRLERAGLRDQNYDERCDSSSDALLARHRAGAMGLAALGTAQLWLNRKRCDAHP
jgi:hypothetical protein